MAALVFPWVTPFAGNPSPAISPWLTAAFCTAMVLTVAAFVGPGTLMSNAVGRAWVLAAVASALIGLIQYLGASHAFIPWVNPTQAGEAFGNLRQRNQFASLMGIGLAALIWQGQGLSRSWSFLLIFLLALGNAASGSRTGALHCIGLVVLALIWRGRGTRTSTGPALFALAAYVLGALLLPWLLSLLTGASGGGIVVRLGETPGCASRSILWSNVLTLIGEKPWLGWGWGELDYAHYVTFYPGQRFCDILDNAHNLPLHLAVELGVPAALLVCGSVVWLVWRERPWNEDDPSRQMVWAVLALIGSHSLLEYPLWYGPFQMALGLCVYLLWSTRGQTPAGVQHRPRVAWFQAAVAMIAVAMVTYAGWDYRRVSQVYLAPAQRDPAFREGTLQKIGDTWLFSSQAQFAELALTPLAPGNALRLHVLAQRLLHYSPEPRVIEKVIESAAMLGRHDVASFHSERYRAAFPKNHEKWAATYRPGRERGVPCVEGSGIC